MNRISVTLLFFAMVMTTLAQTATYSCDAPTGLHAADVGLNYITIEWDNDPNVSSWQVCCCPHDANVSLEGCPVTDTNAFTMPYVFIIYDDSPYHPGYSPLYYDFRVRAYCGDSTWGTWSNVLVVGTAYVGLDDLQVKSVSLYPNPTDDLLNVELSGAGIATVALYDLQGRMVYSQNPSNSPAEHSPTATVNMRNIPAGVYVLRVTDGDGKEYQQKVVRR